MIAGATGKIFNDLNGVGDLGAQVPSAYDEANADLKLNYLLGDHHEFILAQQYTRQFDVPKTNEVVLGDRLKFNYEPQERELGYFEYRGKDVAIFDGAKVNLSYNRQREGEEIIDRATPLTETRGLTDVETFGAALQLNNRLGDGHSCPMASTSIETTMTPVSADSICLAAAPPGSRQASLTAPFIKAGAGTSRTRPASARA